MKLQLWRKTWWMPACLAALAMVSTGCPRNNGPETAAVTVAFTTGEPTSKGAVAIDLAEVESLDVTIEDIVLRPTAGSSVDEVSVFLGPQTINLVDLVGLVEVLASAELEPGSYEELVLVVSAAQLRFVADPLTIVDVELPPGGVVTVPVSLTVESNEDGLLLINLGGLSVFEIDPGVYAFAPDLQVSLELSPVPAQAVGRVADLDLVGQTFNVTKGSASIPVDIAGAVVFLPGDFDTPSGTQADLVNNAQVVVVGTLNLDGSIDADVIVIIFTPGGGEDGDVIIRSTMFDPEEIMVQEGDEVRWVSETNETRSVTNGTSPSDPNAGEAFDLLFTMAGQRAEIKFKEIHVNSGNAEAWLEVRIREEDDDDDKDDDEEFDVHGVIVPLDDMGNAVFDYHDTEVFDTIGMTGRVLVMPRDDDDDDKVTICHIPPGNPSRAHTIRIGRAALQAHLAHGDTIGRCPGDDDDDDDDDDEDDDDDDEDDDDD